MFFGGTLKAMPPKPLSDDGKNIVIRPLAYCKEADIAEFSRLMEFPHYPLQLMWLSAQSPASSRQRYVG